MNSNKVNKPMKPHEVREMENRQKYRRLLRALRKRDLEGVRTNISLDPDDVTEYNIRISPLSLARLLGLQDIATKIEENGGDEFLKCSAEEELWGIRAAILGVPESDSESE